MTAHTLDLALAYLAKHPDRFIFPLAPMRKLPPLIQDNLNNASNDPDKIRAWHKMCPGCNWGLSLSKSRLIVVDVDTKTGKNGAETFFELKLSYGFPKTEMVETPSGGLHHYYREANGVQHVCRIGNAGFGEDVDSPNYVLIPGCPMPDGKTYTALPSPKIADAPAWFAEYLTPKAPKVRDAVAVVDLDTPERIDWAKHYLINDAPPSVAGQGGEMTMFKIACVLRDHAISEALAADLINDLYNVPGKCDPLWEWEGRDGLEHKVHNAYTYANQSAPGEATAEADFAGNDEDVEALKAASEPFRKADPILSARDRGITPEARAEARSRCTDYSTVAETYVWIAGQKMFVRKDKPMKEFWWDKEQLNSIYNELMPKPKKGQREDISRVLLNSKNGIAKYDTVTYRPGLPETGNSTDWYNTWRGSDVVPTAGDTKFWDDHLAYLFPDATERGHLLDWCAWVYQNQNMKPNFAMLLVGAVQGSGKSYVGRVMEEILGPYNTSRPKNSSVKGDFNGWAAQCKLAIVEELLQPGKLEVSNELRSLITEDTIEINEKNVKPYKISNYMAMIATSNSPNAIHLDQDDRRWLVLQTDAGKHPGEMSYYRPLFAKLKDAGAMGAVAHALQSRDVSKFDGHGSAPVTEAKRNMVTASLSDIDTWLHNMSTEPPLNGRVVCLADIANLVPRRLERTRHLDTTIMQYVQRNLKGHNLGQVRTGKTVKRLWGINGYPKPRGDNWQKLAAAQYEKDRAGLPEGNADEAQRDFADE